jgi:hypothetical protein
MDIDKDEIAEELDHHRKMLKELRRRLRDRELQEVKHGINVPPEITSDIHDLTERVQRHESEITRLQTMAAEDKEPLGEVEYRAVLAEIWEKSQPTYAGLTRLELIRLRHGILRERADELEREVRAIVARELLSNYSEYIDLILEHIELVGGVFKEDGEIDIERSEFVAQWASRKEYQKSLKGDNGVDINFVGDMIGFAVKNMRSWINKISYPLKVSSNAVYDFIASRMSLENIIKSKKAIMDLKIPGYEAKREIVLEFLSNIESMYRKS